MSNPVNSENLHMARDNTTSWFLPESIQEFIPPAAESVDQLRRQLLDLYYSYGYQLVMPPLAEYRDVLVSGAGADLDDITINLHSDPGERSLGIRSDFTPQVARIDSRHQASQVSSSRYCYFGETLLAKPRKTLGSRNPFQAGVELFGCPQISADQEMVELMLTSVRQVTSEPLYLQLGHIGIFRRLCQLAELDAAAATLCEQIVRCRSFTDIATFSDSTIADPVIAQAMKELPRMIGMADMLDHAHTLLSPIDAEIDDALSQIEHIRKAIGQLDSQVELVIDLANIRGYSYHNAIVYSCYSDKKLLAQGGRYDGIGTYFGKEQSATGFSIDVDALLSIYQARKHEVVWVAQQQKDAASGWIQQHRNRGGRCVVALEANEQPPSICSHQLIKDTADWVVVARDA